MLRFWLGRGVDGFRVDAVDALYETDDLAQNEPRSYQENVFNVSTPRVCVCVCVCVSYREVMFNMSISGQHLCMWLLGERLAWVGRQDNWTDTCR